MQLVTRGKRAGRHIGTGRQRLRVLRAMGARNASSVFGPPGVQIIAQVAGGIDRLIISATDPYINIRALTKPPEADPQVFEYFGGALGEEFDRANTFAVIVADYQYYAKAVNFVAGGQLISVIVVPDAPSGDLFPAIYISKYDSVTEKRSYVWGNYTFAPGGQYPYFEVVCLGYLGQPADKNLYIAWAIDVFSGSTKVQPLIGVARINRTDDILPESELGAIWPLTTSNGGYIPELPVATSLISLGQNRVAWTQRYNNPDITETVSHNPAIDELPMFISYNFTTGVYTKFSWYTLTPAQPLYSGTPGVGVPNYYNTTSSIGYVGNGVVVACLHYPEPGTTGTGYMMARSANYGASWTLLDYTLQPDEDVGTYEIDPRSNFLSLAPGRVWMFAFSGPESARLTHLHYSEDYGLTWARETVTLNALQGDGTWAIQEGSLPAFGQGITPLYNKFRSGYVYCGTRFSEDGMQAFLDIFDEFSPDANRIWSIRILAGLLTSVGNRDLIIANFSLAVFYDPLAPLLPGHPGELGDSNT